MRLTVDEIVKHGINLKAWLGEMQRASRGESAPVFALKGPCTLKVRKRRFSGNYNAPPSGAATTTVTHAFFGGEEFRIGGVTSDKSALDQTFLISVTLTPAKMTLSKEMSGMSLTLSECCELLSGFEEWCDSFGNFKYQEPEKKPPSLAEQREANTMWGSW